MSDKNNEIKMPEDSISYNGCGIDKNEQPKKIAMINLATNEVVVNKEVLKEIEQN